MTDIELDEYHDEFCQCQDCIDDRARKMEQKYYELE